VSGDRTRGSRRAGTHRRHRPLSERGTASAAGPAS
jgi:hypothetical protein